MSSNQSDKTPILVFAAAAILITLVIGVSVVAWLAIRANTAQQVAVAEADRTAQAEQSAKEVAERVRQSEQQTEIEVQQLTAAEEQRQKLQAELTAERKEKETAIAGEEAIANLLVEILQSPNSTRDGRNIWVVELLDNASNQLETSLEEQPKRRARLQSILGDGYRSLGLEQKAIPLLEKARDYQLANSSSENPESITAIESLAKSYRNTGRLDEAIKLFEEVLNLNRKLLGSEHPKTVEAISNLASLYAEVGRKDEALKMFETLVPMYRKILGPEHPNTLSAFSNLASLYAEFGRPDEALKLREEVVKLCRKVLGPEHPETLSAASNLASSYAEADRVDEAVQLLNQTVEVSRKMFGPQHLETLRAVEQLKTLSIKAKPDNDQASDSPSETPTEDSEPPTEDSQPPSAETIENSDAVLTTSAADKKKPSVIPNLTGVPEWLKTHEFKQDKFTFARIKWGEETNQRGKRWKTDFPAADLNLASAIGHFTTLNTTTPSEVVELTDPKLKDYPFTYISEPGTLQLTEEEIAALRTYLNNGGFLMTDDFWGNDEWENLRSVMKQIFPDRASQKLTMTHPMFHCVFDIRKMPQVPGIGYFSSAGKAFERPGTEGANFHAILDDNDRVMVLMCHNTDLADGWERISDDETYRREMSEAKAFPMGLNIVFYAFAGPTVAAEKAAEKIDAATAELESPQK